MARAPEILNVVLLCGRSRCNRPVPSFVLLALSSFGYLLCLPHWWLILTTLVWGYGQFSANSSNRCGASFVLHAGGMGEHALWVLNNRHQHMPYVS